MSESILEQDQIDDAHGRSFFFRGERLEPFSIDRQFTWGRVTEGLAPIEEDCYIVFLCTLKGDSGESLMEASYSSTGMKALRSAFKEWCQKIKLTIHKEDPARKEIRDVASQIWKDISASTFTTEKTSTGGNG